MSQPFFRLYLQSMLLSGREVYHGSISEAFASRGLEGFLAQISKRGALAGLARSSGFCSW
eukprot:6213738-Pleurochrysis_carterae.AAC.2